MVLDINPRKKGHLEEIFSDKKTPEKRFPGKKFRIKMLFSRGPFSRGFFPGDRIYRGTFFRDPLSIPVEFRIANCKQIESFAH